MGVNFVAMMKDLVNLNMKIAIGYLLAFIGFAVYMSLNNPITQVPLTSLVFGISLLSIVCIPFFSYFNVSNSEEFSLLDYILNFFFLILVMINAYFLYTMLF